MQYSAGICRALFLLISISFTSQLFAASYQFAVGAGLDQSTTSYGSGVDDQDTDTKRISFTYHLQPVTASVGPLGERAFLSKSASIIGSLGEKNISGDLSDNLYNLNARFVTEGNLIFDFGYEKDTLVFSSLRGNDDGTGPSDILFGSIDREVIRVGFGKYLDDRSQATISIDSSEASADTRTLSGNYRKLVDGRASDTYMAYELGLHYIDTEIDSGYQASATGLYYPSIRLSMGAYLTYLDVGENTFTGTTLLGQYFFTDSLSGGVFYALSRNSNDTDIDTIGASISARF